MSAATVLTSSMAGMPALNGAEGSLAALIRYIAPILGWSIEYDNGPVIVIRPQSYKGGQALLYRFDDRAARGGAAPRVAEVRAYETMSDINTGSGLVGPVYAHKSYYANTTAYAYTIAGDRYGFFINNFLYKNSGADSEPLSIAYYGFLNQVYSNDIPICCAFADGVDGMSYGSRIVCNAYPDWGGAPGMAVHRNRTGSLNVTVSVMSTGVLDIPGHAIGSFRKTSNFNSIKTFLPGIVASPIYTNDGSVFTLGYALPAFSRQSTDVTGFLYIQGWDGIAITGYDAGSLLIDLGDGFRP